MVPSSYTRRNYAVVKAIDTAITLACRTLALQPTRKKTGIYIDLRKECMVERITKKLKETITEQAARRGVEIEFHDIGPSAFNVIVERGKVKLSPAEMISQWSFRPL